MHLFPGEVGVAKRMSLAAKLNFPERLDCIRFINMNHWYPNDLILDQKHKKNFCFNRTVQAPYMKLKSFSGKTKGSVFCKTLHKGLFLEGS